jgi:5-methyltetrahydropteroyltriglutamate--homocysteine methyltransferase
LQLDRAYKAIAPMTDKPVKIGSISAQILALMLTNEYYKDRYELLMDLSAALNKEYHSVADAGAPLVQIEEPAIHQVIADPKQPIKPEQWVEAFNVEAKGLRKKCEVWCHTCWGSPAAQRVASKDQSYKAALPYLNQLDVDVLTIEGAFNRGMDLEHVGKMISKDKKIALGVISHRTLQVERPEEIADLIRKALKYIEPERLILTSDCGFGRQSMSRMHAFYKMVALTRGTNIVRMELGIEEAYIPATDKKLSMVPLTA